MKRLRYALEGAMAASLFGMFSMLPVSAASAIGGALGRIIGPLLAVNRKAVRHLNLALPAIETQKTLREMWDNLGRVMAEYPHLATIANHHVTIRGAENLPSPDCPAIFIGAHLANWEVCGAAAFLRHNIPIELTYRAPNNPWTARLLNRARSLGGTLKTHPKTAESGRAMIAALKSGKALGILIDQKYNEGLETTFFGHAAMTNPIFASLAQKYDAALIPIQIIRTKGCNFEVIVHPRIPTHTPEGTPRPIPSIIAQAQELLESWITAHPGQWIWLHRRWRA